jgi:hypothetical protein
MRYPFLLVRVRCGAGVDDAPPRRRPVCVIFGGFPRQFAIAFAICPLMLQKCAFRCFGPINQFWLIKPPPSSGIKSRSKHHRVIAGCIIKWTLMIEPFFRQHVSAANCGLHVRLASH